MNYPARIFVGVSRDGMKRLLERRGAVIKEIEKATGTKITVNRETGQVVIDATGNASDLLKAKDMIRAIDLGFTPEEALRLKSPEVYLDVIDLREYFGHSRNNITRVKGRIIGSGGKTRHLIMEFTGADVHVGDHYVAIIGTFDEIQGAKRAVEMLIDGAPHAVVYRFLERFKAERRRMEILGGGGIG